MIEIKKILVPIDFSEHSRIALGAAVDIAERFGASIELLHVVAIPVYPALYDAYVPTVDYTQQGLIEEATKELKAWSESQTDSKVNFELTVQEGPPARGIVEAASGDGADLIVMATRGLTGLQHVFLGSVAEHVVRSAPCPVLTINTHDGEAAPAADGS